MKSALRVAGSLVLSGIFLYYAARGVSWGLVWEALGEAKLLYVVPMTIGTILPIVFRALRWQVLLRPLREIPFRPVFSATAIGFAANMLLPLRAGEIARPWVLSRKEPIGFSQAMATVALERLFDMATLLLLFAVATLVLPVPEEWKRYGWFFLFAFLVLFVLLFVMQRYPKAALRLTERITAFFPDRIAGSLRTLVGGFVEGLASLGSSRTLVVASVQSLGVWLSIALSFGFGLSALSLEVPWFRGALTTTTFVAIAVSIPGGPGFIGMFQAGCVVALEVFGVPKSLAFSYSVLTHLVQFAATVGLGLCYFLAEGFGMTEIRRLEEPLEAGAELAEREPGNVRTRR